MPKKTGLLALAGAAVGVGAGLVVERSMVRRRRLNDVEVTEPFGKRRGVRRRTIELDDGAHIFVEEAGPETTRGAVFIHGSALRTDVWHYQIEGLGDHRLVFYDLRGHGLSQPKGSAEYSLRTLAADLECVIEDAGLEEVVIVGHSVGGMIALDLCANSLDMLSSSVKGLVLVNTTHRPAYETITGGAAVARLERAIRHPLDILGSQHMTVDRLRKIIKPSDSLFLTVSFAAFGPHASAHQIDFTYDMLAETPTDVLFDLFKCYRHFDVTDVLGDIAVPVLVIAGTHDRLTVSGASQDLAEHLPKAELKLIEGCGHMTMLERHGEFNTMVRGFLDDTLEAEAR
ncbi:MAG: alpha/beta fold hydrolase [Actinomycetota bacterium]